jgi:hypothetical protein
MGWGRGNLRTFRSIVWRKWNGTELHGWGRVGFAWL